MVVMSSLPPPSVGIRHEQPSTRLFINTRDYGKGTLYIAESRLAWVDSCTDRGFSIEYRHVSLHAISRDTQAYPHECLYVMLDTALPIENGAGDGSGDANRGDADNDDEELDITEIRFVPDDKSVLDVMFQAMSECQSLHPDSDNSFSSEEENQGEEDDEDEEKEYYFEDGPNRINGLSRETGMDVDGQFDDAEEEQEN